jgi:hypothetical protein
MMKTPITHAVVVYGAESMGRGREGVGRHETNTAQRKLKSRIVDLGLGDGNGKSNGYGNVRRCRVPDAGFVRKQNKERCLNRRGVKSDPYVRRTDSSR